MIFDIDKIKSYYKNLDSVITKIRQKISRPLTLTEKILYSHSESVKDFSRGDSSKSFC